MSRNKNLTKPCFKNVEGNEWIIFPDSIPPPLQHPKDCPDAVESICPDVDLNECILKCAESDRCDFGYHIKTPKRNYCLPLYTSDYYPDANPLYYLKNKDAFEKTKSKNVIATSFLDTKIWAKNNILPDEANAVFYGDNVSLKNNRDGKTFGLTRDGGSPIFVENNGYTDYLKLKNIYSSELVDKIQYGDSVSFQIKQKTDKGFENTSEVLTEKDSGINNEAPAFEDINQSVQTNNEKFTIIPTRKFNSDQTVNYSDDFLLRTAIGYLENKKVGEDYKLVVNNNYNPKLDGLKDSFVHSFYNNDKPLYYCQNGKCIQETLGNAKTKGIRAMYNGNVAYTRSDCFGSCAWKSIGNCSNGLMSGKSVGSTKTHPFDDVYSFNYSNNSTSIDCYRCCIYVNLSDWFQSNLVE